MRTVVWDKNVVKNPHKTPQWSSFIEGIEEGWGLVGYGTLRRLSTKTLTVSLSHFLFSRKANRQDKPEKICKVQNMQSKMTSHVTFLEIQNKPPARAHALNGDSVVVELFLTSSCHEIR